MRFRILLFLIAGWTAGLARASDPHAHVPDINQLIHDKFTEASESTTETTEIFSPVARRDEQTGFRFSIETPQIDSASSSTLLLARLDRFGPEIPDKVADVSVWWTNPSGERAHFPLRLIDNGHWASLVDSGAAEGHHRLVVLVTHESPSSDVDKIVEEIYDFELPSSILTPRGRRELGDAPPPIEELVGLPMEFGAIVPAPKVHGQPLTFGAVALPFLYLNVFVVVMLIAGVMALRRIPDTVRHVLWRQLSKFPGMSDGRGRLRDVLMEAGLIDAIPDSPPIPPRVRKQKTKGKVIQAATIDESQIERALVEDEESPVRPASPAIVDAGKKTQMLIQRLKEQQPEDNNESAKPGDSPEDIAEVEPRGAMGKPQEDLTVDLNDLAF